jgi:hypothetical protein
LTDINVTGRYNIREDNVVVIDLVAATKEFGFFANQNISECSFQKVGHDRRCVGHQQQPWSQCSIMKLAVQKSTETCFIHNQGLTSTGILAKKLYH